MPLLITIIYSCLVIFLVIMPSPSCAFCGRRITGHVPGRAATAEQLERATAYHHPKTPRGTFICDRCRKNIPTTNQQQKRSRSPSPATPSSSDMSSCKKRQRTAEILSSLSQPASPTPLIRHNEPVLNPSCGARMTSSSTSSSAKRQRVAEILSALYLHLP